MSFPSLTQAQQLLTEAETLNPGPWVQHSIYVAQAAEHIAHYHPDLDPETALILGYLHDIGRRFGVTDNRHILDGYLFLQAQGYPGAARIALTHSFPIQNPHAVAGQWDCTDDEFRLVSNTLSQLVYTKYDHLLQLCDALALPTGFCLLEKRFVDVAVRRGTNEYTVPRWQAYFEIKQTFETEIGRSIYTLLPGIIQNTFGFTDATGNH